MPMAKVRKYHISALRLFVTQPTSTWRIRWLGAKRRRRAPFSAWFSSPEQCPQFLLPLVIFFLNAAQVGQIFLGKLNITAQWVIGLNVVVRPPLITAYANFHPGLRISDTLAAQRVADVEVSVFGAARRTYDGAPNNLDWRAHQNQPP